MSKIKILVGLVVVGVVIGGALWWVKTGGGKAAAGGANGAAVLSSTTSDGTVQNTPAVAAAAKAAASVSLDEVYTSTDYGFALKYPNIVEPTEIPGDDSSPSAPLQTIIFDVPADAAPTSGDSVVPFSFQITISKFDEANANITPERILQDVPDMVINSPQAVNLGEGRGRGTTFIDGDVTSPDTNRQIWFAGGGYLYQISAPALYDTVMKKILATWTMR